MVINSLFKVDNLLTKLLIKMVIISIVYLVVILTLGTSEDILRFINGTLPLLMFYFMVFTFYKRLLFDNYNFWCPLNWFLLSASVGFGLSPLLWIYASEPTLIKIGELYQLNQFELLRTNFLNSISIIFLIMGYLYIKRENFGNYRYKKLQLYNYSALKNTIIISFIIFLPFYVLFQLPADYGDYDKVLPSFFYIIGKLGIFIILLSGLLWGCGFYAYRYFSIIFCTFLVSSQMLGFGKASMLYPILALTIGFFWGRRKVSSLLIGGFFSLFFLVYVAMPVSEAGRDIKFSYQNISLQERIDVVFITMLEEMGIRDKAFTNSNDDNKFLLRNNFSSVQAYEMKSYDEGNPGDSLRNIFAAFIPRILWPSKPDITEVGFLLDAAVKNLTYSTSSLAPTFNGEAYWNAGYIGVILVSIIIGMQYAHLSIGAYKNLSSGDYRYLFIALAGILYGISYESWIVATFVGGFITIILTWILIKYLVPIKL